MIHASVAHYRATKKGGRITESKVGTTVLCEADLAASASDSSRQGWSLVQHPEITHGKGLRLYARDGREYLDAVSGTFNLPLGYDHPEVVAAVRDQAAQITHLSSDLSRPQAERLLKRLIELAPVGIEAGWLRDVTGSTAIECAIKIAQKATGATDIITLFLSHHGQTLFATAVSGSSFRRSFPGANTGFSVRVPAPYCQRCFYRQRFPECELLCVDRIRDFIRYSCSGSVACIIVEPILGNGGNIVPPLGYFEKLQQLCREEGILVIADEVQTGIGRTGHMFASEACGLEPDLIVLAKGLGGIGVPIAAVLMKRELDILESYQHSFTAGGNLLGIAAALATLNVISGDGFLAEVKGKGLLLEGLLRQLQERHSCIGDVRGRGMMWGVEIVDSDGMPDPERTNRITKIAIERFRLILRSSAYGFGNVVKVRPALVATEKDLRVVVSRLSRAIVASG